MSLKLIREAALVATLSEAEIKALSTIKAAVGASSLVDIVAESFTPSDDDFDAWMRVVVGSAPDYPNLNIGKKSDFMQIAMDVLEHDPGQPPFDMQEMIANKLWQDYNSAKNAVRINKLAQAKEEEEKVMKARDQIAARYAKGPAGQSHAGEEEKRPMQPMGISDDLAAKEIFQKIQGTPNLNFASVERLVVKYAPMVGKAPTDVKHIAAQVYSMLQDRGVEEEESGFEQALNVAVGVEEEESQYDSDRPWYDFEGNLDPEGAYDVNGQFFPSRSAVFRKFDSKVDPTEEEEDGVSFLRDVLKDRPERSSVKKGSFSSHLRGEDELDDNEDVEVSFGPDGIEGVSDGDVFTSDDERECTCADDELADDVHTDEFADDDLDPPADELDDETMDDVDADVAPRSPKKGFDEEEAVKSFFRQAVTSPNDMMRKAVKDIEEEGKSAWTQANVPSNPHPKKSQAYRAWQKGLTNAAKEALGIADKPSDPKAKPKRKK